MCLALTNFCNHFESISHHWRCRWLSNGVSYIYRLYGQLHIHCNYFSIRDSQISYEYGTTISKRWFHKTVLNSTNINGLVCSYFYQHTQIILHYPCNYPVTLKAYVSPTLIYQLMGCLPFTFYWIYQKSRKVSLYSETTWAVSIAQLTHHEVQGGGKNFAPTADRVVN